MKKVCQLHFCGFFWKKEADILFSFKYPQLQSGLFAKSRELILSFLQIWFFHVFSSLVGWYVLEQFEDEDLNPEKGAIWQKKPPNLPLCAWDSQFHELFKSKFWQVLLFWHNCVLIQQGFIFCSGIFQIKRRMSFLLLRNQKKQIKNFSANLQIH